jgi:hypothetical protein
MAWQEPASAVISKTSTNPEAIGQAKERLRVYIDETVDELPAVLRSGRADSVEQRVAAAARCIAKFERGFSVGARGFRY